MATYNVYAAASYAAAAEKAAEGLTALGCFDSVTVTDAAANSKVITCKIDDATVATFTLSSSGGLATVFGNYSEATNNGFTYHIGIAANGVFIDGVAVGALYTYAVFKSKTGKPMFAYVGPGGQASGIGYFALDTQNPARTAYSNPLSSPYYSTLATICAGNGTTENVSVADGAAEFKYRLSSISATSLTDITVGGKKYQTDGHICIRDE